jgi:hypothetical protein
MGIKTNDCLLGGEEGCKQNLFEGHEDFRRK